MNKIVSKVEKLGMIDDTYFIFTSDHGYHIGQFGMVKVNILDFKRRAFTQKISVTINCRTKLKSVHSKIVKRDGIQP